MAVLKLPLLKQKITRKASSRSSRAKPKAAKIQREVSNHTQKPFPAVFSTLRSTSAAKLLTVGRVRQLGFLTAPARQPGPGQRRKIIHVATLNFGPYEDTLSVVAASHMPRATSQAGLAQKEYNHSSSGDRPIPKQDSGRQGDGVAHIDSSVDVTLPSVYSRDSWVEVNVMDAHAMPVITIWGPTASAED
ncbi:hypothetical protein NM688_g1029 [Phlebia brevispora]|uniref:Uncharacterized protein n=1 Tax=Phlebia brevispora TaxID=194682 RepID=A0ACC1TCW3_9APHY|nr:hypothetical protein NM688_g1029 [Phlebia brevispora]